MNSENMEIYSESDRIVPPQITASLHLPASSFRAIYRVNEKSAYVIAHLSR